MVTDKDVIEEEIETPAEEQISETAPEEVVRVPHEFLREDLNDMRDAVNELWRKCV